MLRKNRINLILIDYILMTFGCFFTAVSLNVFLLPNKLSTGGASGIGVILYYLYNIPVSLTVLLVNIPLFIIALKNLGFKFCLRAIIGTLLLVVFIQITSAMAETLLVQNLKDSFIGSVFGGLMLGTGLSLVFKAEGSTGGSDLLAQIIYKKRPISSIGQILLILDSFVIITNSIVFKSISTGLYSVVALYISKKTTDVIFEGVYYTKAVNIISKRGSEIAKEIITKTGRGVTTSKCIGVYTNQEYIHVISIITVSQIPKIKKIVKDIDKGAFTYISNTNEVLGMGFKEIE